LDILLFYNTIILFSLSTNTVYQYSLFKVFQVLFTRTNVCGKIYLSIKLPLFEKNAYILIKVFKEVIYMNYMELDELVFRAKNNDEGAMENLLKEYNYFIIKYASRVYINGYEMDDLIQMANITVIRCVENYTPGKGNFTSYVTYAIKNNFNYLIRQRAKENLIETLEAPVSIGLRIEDTLMDNTSTEDDYIKNELYKLIRVEVDKLEENLKDIITFIYLDCQGNLKEYSQSRNLQYSTAAKRKTLAFTKLRSKLNSILE
jgi:RNA polymerase sporulation-specific sigma factor